MKISLIFARGFLYAFFILGSIALAEETTEPQVKENMTGWQQELKSEYGLTDEQVKTLQDKGLTGTSAVRVASLAKSSGKTLDEIAAMRVDKKMGWGKIANELGVPPGEVGKALARMQRSGRADGRSERRERKQKSERGERGGHDKDHGRGKGGH